MILLTAKLNIRMLVVFLMVLSKMTTMTTRMLPMKPMMMTRVKRMGTTMGTTEMRVLRCAMRASTCSLVFREVEELVIFREGSGSGKSRV